MKKMSAISSTTSSKFLDDLRIARIGPVTSASALINASCDGEMALAEALVEYGANVEAEDNWPLIVAAANGHTDMLKFLLRHGAKAEARNFEALVVASRFGFLETAQFLLSASSPNNEALMRALAAAESSASPHRREVVSLLRRSSLPDLVS